MTLVQPAGMCVTTKQPCQVYKAQRSLPLCERSHRRQGQVIPVTQKWVATADLSVNEAWKIISTFWMLRHLPAERF